MTNPDPKEIAKLIVSRFVERRDVKAIQTRTGAYMPVREDMKKNDSPTIPFTLRDVVDHVEGSSTYGHYVVSTDGNCRVIVFDIDLRAKANVERGETPIIGIDGTEIDPREVWSGPPSEQKKVLARDLRILAEGFAKRSHRMLELPVMVAYSGNKGMHAYICLDPATPASDARDMAHLVMDSFGGLIVPDKGKNFYRHADQFAAMSIEVFPKQDEVKSDGFGNLVRLPLGVNQKSGKAGFFVDISTPPDVFRKDDPILALTEGSIR